jgi:uncharacterized membrane protein YedE/YeeE
VLLSLFLIQHFASLDSLLGRVLAGSAVAIPIFIQTASRVRVLRPDLQCFAVLSIVHATQKSQNSYRAILIGALFGLRYCGGQTNDRDPI